MKTKILLLTPPFNILSEGKGSLFSFKGYGNHIPLGIAHLASVLEQEGHEVHVIDCAAERLPAHDLVPKICEVAPDIIGISATTASKTHTYELANTIKQYANIPLILGGSHAMAFSDSILEECDALDIVCHAEGEIVAIHLLEALGGSMPLEKVEGISYRKQKTVQKNTQFPIVQNLDDIPVPAYHKFNLELYKALPRQVRKRPYLPYITSRGCSYGKCSFCFQAGRVRQRYRRMSPERVVHDVVLLAKQFSIREIVFWDDNFLVGDAWLRRFAELMSEHRLDLSWSCYGRVDTVNEHILALLSQVGLWNIFFGFETADRALLQSINKGITLEQAKSAARICNRLGIDIRGSFMLALPGSNPHIDKTTVEFAKELDLSYAQFHITFPEYGTQLYERALQEGRILKTVEFKGRTTATYIPDGYNDAREIEHLSRWAYLHFYCRPTYIIKHLKRLRSFDDLKEYLFGAFFVIGIILGKVFKQRKQ